MSSLPAPKVQLADCQQNFDALGTMILWGTGAPNGRISAPVGALWLRKDGTPGFTLYVKESGGAGDTGWAPK